MEPGMVIAIDQIGGHVKFPSFPALLSGESAMDDLIVADPVALFSAWLREAEGLEPYEANAMALATVGEDGMPSLRMVLLKDVDARGFVFYTNLGSRKGRQLAQCPKAALCFHWKSLKRQVRVEGPVEAVSEAEADAYFGSRSRGSQLGAWASRQSEPMSGRGELVRRVAEVTARYPIARIPRPPFWSGFRVIANRIEFWRDGTFRLHERALYTRAGEGWQTAFLYP
jgi:pyridoxamine 5'-phosphate oxidase